MHQQAVEVVAVRHGPHRRAQQHERENILIRSQERNARPPSCVAAAPANALPDHPRDR